MGKNSWTHSLAQIAMTSHPNETLVKVDGPYGYPPNCAKCQVVLLVAGGLVG